MRLLLFFLTFILTKIFSYILQVYSIIVFRTFIVIDLRELYSFECIDIWAEGGKAKLSNEELPADSRCKNFAFGELSHTGVVIVI
jgi:hypothetical protein